MTQPSVSLHTHTHSIKDTVKLYLLFVTVRFDFESRKIVLLLTIVGGTSPTLWRYLVNRVMACEKLKI